MRYVPFRKCLAVLSVLVLAATGLWAAGEEEGSTATAADKKYVTDPTTGKVVTAPEYGGTLTVLGFPGSAANSHDPFFNYVANPGGGVTEKLGIVNWGLDRDVSELKTLYFPTSLMIGRLAESWEQPDTTTYVFHIRKGVHWHDKAPMNGRELTAHDIVFNFHRMLGMGDFADAGPSAAPNAADLIAVPWESITATDDATVVMKLKEPYLDTMRIVLVEISAFILPPEVIEQHGDLQDWRNLVGTGPFMLTDVVEDSSVTYIRNPDYWGHDEKYPENRLPYVDEVKIAIMTEEGSILAALRSGTLDFRSGASSLDSIDSLRKTNPEITAHTVFFRSVSSFVPDHRRPPFNDINVRRAMQMVLDNENVAATYWKGLADPTPHGLVGVNGFFVPFEEWDEEVKQYYRYDPEAAEKLLDEAGYPRGADGTRFKTTLNYGSWASLDYSEIAVAYWGEIGVEVEIDVLTYAEYHERMFSRTGDGMYSGIAANQFNPVYMANNYHTDHKWNRGGSQWPELDVRVDAVNGARTTEEQQRLIADADRYAMSRHWLIYGPKSPSFYLAQPWLVGYNGELDEALSRVESNTLFARLWIDSALKKEMGY